jgi:serine/threonine protein kinase/Tol biopolymer transport system component
MIGTKLAHYEITAHLGSGGMGDVYRARDTKLKRDVAIKILPEEFSCDADRLSRFQHEAEVLASLNHPNIAAIYDLEEANQTRFLVLELVEGETLADRVERGPCPLEEALHIAKSICAALEAAHEKGMAHRDLKPANVKITPEGKVKVLDFGLAKALQSETGKVDLSNSPTLMSASMPGAILGTTAYMSPEQAKGAVLDRRSDIFAFGAVLYEMLAGQRAFPGDTVTEILAAVIRAEPDWSNLSADVPAGIRRLLSRCLQKDRGQRLRDIADARFQIEEALSNDSISSETAVRHTRNLREWAGWVVAVAFLSSTVFFAIQASTNAPAGEPTSFSVFPPEKTAFSGAVNTTVNVPEFAISPDGRALVFSAEAPGRRPMLWLRLMERESARELAGTEDAQDPFWSPDGRWIGFFAAGKVKKIPANGGPVQVVTQTAADFRGGTWGPEDTFPFGSGSEIVLVKSVGGKTTPVMTSDASHSPRNPYFLPDGNHFLYTVWAGTEEIGVYVGSLDGKTKKLLIHVATSAVYVPPGYLLFVDGDTLLAQAFDSERLELRGQPLVVGEHVGRNSSLMSAVSASRTGTIAYAGAIPQSGRLTWIDRSGNAVGSIGTEGDYTDFRLSPDEKRVAFSLVDPKAGTIEIWLTDLARNSTSRFAFGAVVTASVIWSPDGSRLAFRNPRNGRGEFFLRSAAGGGNDQSILHPEAYEGQILSVNLIPTDWSADGRNILFSAPAPGSGNDLWLLPLSGDGKPTKLIASPADEIQGSLSPDGHLVAYTSNESGKYEVYVETLPRSDRKWPVSTSGGYEPRWRADGGELYYLSEDRKLMAVSVGPGPSFGVPKPLFQTRVSAGVTANRTHYVPGRDGRRFLVNQSVDAAPNPITVVLNWTGTRNKK